MNILFTCVGRRHYLIDYFQKVKPKGSFIVGADMQSTSPGMAIVDKKYVVPSVCAQNYVETLASICKKEKISAIISLNDLELPVLSESENYLKRIGVKVIVSRPGVIDICFDKWKTLGFAESIGIASPRTYLNLNSAIKAIENDVLRFPLVIKPRWGSASIGIEFCENIEELKLAFTLLEKKLFRSMLGTINKANVQRAILIQEKINGTEYGLDVFNDLEGNCLDVYVKEKIAMRAGETDKAVLRNHKDIEKLGKCIGENLNHVGNLDCDIFEFQGRYYLLEMNPRFGGGYPFSQMAGANFPAAIYALLKGEFLQKKWFSKDYNKIFAKYDGIIQVSSF